MNRNDDAFDASLRNTWRNAAHAVPPALARRLRPGPGTPSRLGRTFAGWPLGAAVAAVALLAIGAGLRPHPASVLRATGPPPMVVANLDDATATLDRNPDFYAWLASPDAEQLALE